MVGHKRSLASGFRFCSFGGCEEGGNVPEGIPKYMAQRKIW